MPAPQKETPASGDNHPAGENTQNAAIIDLQQVKTGYMRLHA